jgi:hypothetical protein
LSGCVFESEPIDYQAQACSTTNEILDAFTAVPPPDDFSEMEASNAILAANLAVWKSEGGASDSTFKLLSTYAGKLLLFLADGSPSSAQGLIDFEETSGSDLLYECGISSVEYVGPLEIDGGCWNQSGTTAELQEKISGNWVRHSIVRSLSKTSNCSDLKAYPWGVKLKVTRGFTSVKNISEWESEYRIVWTDSDGESFSDGTYTHYSCVEKTTRQDDSIDLWWKCE